MTAGQADDFEDLVDFVLPILPPYEFAVYTLLLRRRTNSTVRIGVRTIAEAVGQGTRANKPNYRHVQKKLLNLVAQGFVVKRDTNWEGTLYEVRSPREVPVVAELMSTAHECTEQEPDYFTDPALRAELFDRDRWRCKYCGELLSEETATLDHVQPRHLGGSNDPMNLATCCLMCNSIKSGRTFEESAADILKDLAARRSS